MTLSHRPTIFLISIVWLSTALIFTPMASRNAHSLNFDAPQINYPTSEVFNRIEKINENIGRKSEKDATEFIEIASIISDETDHFWIKNQSTNTLPYPFLPYHSYIPQPISRLTPTDYWLDVPSGTNVIDDSGIDDVETQNWLRINLGEFDQKRNPFIDYIYKPRTDLFDPSQVVVQKFTSIFLVIASILIFMLFSTCAGLVFLDKFVFRTVLQNCFRLDKNISWSRTKKELRRFFKFVLKVLMVIILYIMLNAGFLFICHKYIVPMPTVIKIFSVLDVDPVVWEKNIEIGIFGDIGAEYERWSQNQNISPKMSRFWQEFLWNNWYILVALMLYFGSSFYLSVFKISMGFFKRYRKGVIRRKYFYYSVDRSRLAKKTIAQNNEVCCDNDDQDSIDQHQL